MEEDDIFRQIIRYEDKSRTQQSAFNTNKVLDLLKYNPKIKAKEMVEITKLSLRTIRRILDNLANQNIIERQGSRKDGIWIVKDKNDFAI